MWRRGYGGRGRVMGGSRGVVKIINAQMMMEWEGEAVMEGRTVVGPDTH